MSQVTVVGTTFDCDVVDVQIRCVKIAALKQVMIGPGNVFTATFPAADLKAAGCLCGGTVTVDVTCSNGKCKAQSWTGKLACCQDIAVSAVVGECNGDGERLVMLFAQNSGPTAATPSWDFGDGQTGAAFALPIGPPVGTQHAYQPPGPYPAKLKLPGCPDLPVSITVPPCCTKLMASATVGECDESGKRPVTLVVQNAGSVSATPTWNYGDGHFGNPFTLAPGATHTEQHSYLPPGPYTATLTVPGCPSQDINVEIPGCCTELVVSATVGKCDKLGKRMVTLVAQNAQSLGSTSVVATWNYAGNAGTPFTLAPGATHTEQHLSLPGTYPATLTIPGCPPQSVTVKVPVCCPAITVAAQVGKCNPDGTRTVTLHASNAGPPVSSIYWVFGQSPPQIGSPFSLGVGTPHSENHDYAPGTYTATLMVGEGCPGVPVTFTVEPCCPQITVSAKVGDCDRDGKRLVTLQATNAGPPANGIYWVYGDGSPNGSPFSLGVGTTNTSTHGYAPKTPASYTATLKIPGCPDVPVTFDVPPCCPTVTISATVGACNAGKRDVTLHASSTGPGTVNAYWKFGDGLQGALFPLGPNASGSEQHTYGAGPYTVTLVLPDCPAQSLTLNVAECPPCPPCPPGCTSIPDLPPGCIDLTLPGCPAGCVSGCAGCLGCGGSCMGCLCRILCWLWIILLAGYLLGIATGALANVVALAIATVVLVLFAWLYIKLCKLCSLVKCTWIALIVFIVVVVFALLFGVVLVGLGPALLVAAGIFVAALLVNYFFCTGKIGF
ncbi:MAG TPA: hypothetical protein VF092_23305 [Longimicrobium sp.]